MAKSDIWAAKKITDDKQTCSYLSITCPCNRLHLWTGEGGEETEPDSFGHLTHTYKYFRAGHTCRDVAVKVSTKSGLTLLSNPPNILIPS